MKIAFSDFWWLYDSHRNFFVDACRSIKENIYVVQPHEADVLFFSCFGSDHKKYSCKKVYYTGESCDPPWNDCDIALSFNKNESKGTHFRLPLWMLYIDWFNRGNEYKNPQFMFSPGDLVRNKFTRVTPTFECCGVYNRDPIGNRSAFMKKLSQKMPGQVHAYGEMHSHRIPYGEDRKCEVVCNYKFNMCFENLSKPGYHTEKLLHAKLCGTVPIYWSADTYAEDFNKNCCLQLNRFESIDHLVEEVLLLSHDKNRYTAIASEPLFLSSPSLDSFYDFLKEKILC